MIRRSTTVWPLRPSKQRLRSMGRAQITYLEDHQEAHLPIWTEALFATELLMLHADPLYYGFGAAHGDGSGVIVIPGFLCPDSWLMPMLHWLERMGYQSFYSGIGFNNECPNLLIQSRLNETIDQAVEKTGRKVHLIGHSLGGIMARSIAGQRSKDIASVITLGAPLRGLVAHGSVLRAAEQIRLSILEKHPSGVLPQCYTARCTCEFAKAARTGVPDGVMETAIYTEDDGVVDWRYCKTDDCSANFAVHGTHVGLVFNPSVYRIIAHRLAAA